MSGTDIWLLVSAGVLTVLAGAFSSADAALSSFSKARAEQIAEDGQPGAARLLRIVEDPPRYLNTALFLRMLCEIAAIVMVTVVSLDLIIVGGNAETGPEVGDRRWLAMLTAIAISLVVSSPRARSAASTRSAWRCCPPDPCSSSPRCSARSHGR